MAEEKKVPQTNTPNAPQPQKRIINRGTPDNESEPLGDILKTTGPIASGIKETPSKPTSIHQEKEESPIRITRDGNVWTESEESPVNNKSSVPALRTYESDVAAAVKDKGETAASIALKEQEKRRKEHKKASPEQLKKSRKRTAKFVGILIVLGLIVIAGITFIPPYLSRTYVEKDIIPQEIVRVDDRVEVDIDNTNPPEILSLIDKKVSNNKIDIGSMRNIFFAKSVVVDEKETRVLASTGEFFSSIDSNIPSNLLRALDPERYMFGMYSTGTNYPFIVLKVSSFENAFSGMLAWENIIELDNEPIFSILSPEKTNPTTLNTDSEEDQSTTPNTTTFQEFQDVIVGTSDARVLLHPNNQTRIVYSFIDRETIIISSDEKTLLEVARRIK